MLWLVCYMTLATAVSRLALCATPLHVRRPYKVLSSFAAPDIAGRASIGALPHSAEGHREDSWFSVFVRAQVTDLRWPPRRL